MSQQDPNAQGQNGQDEVAVVVQKVGEALSAGEQQESRPSTPAKVLDWDHVGLAERRAVFADKEEIKRKVRETLDQKQAYNVAMYYHETGWARRIATDHIFENTTLAVIAFNAMYMALETDWNKAPTGHVQAGFAVMEQLFCVYFTVEWVVRFCAFKKKCDGRKDAWFVFDTTLVFMMVFETWILAIFAAISGGGGELPIPVHLLRIFRLLRLSRLMRMMRNLPELMILIKGMVTAMQSVVWVMCLQILITYVFAILFTQLCGNVEGLEPFFKNIPLSMWSLFIYATCLDNLADFMNAIRSSDAAWYALPFALIFIALATLTIMNMLIGVLCDVVSAVAESEREENRFLDVREKMTEVMAGLDTNQDMEISFEEFSSIMEKKDVWRLLQDVDVDPMAFIDFGQLYFFDDSTEGEKVEVKLTFDEFMTMIMDLRENNQATVKCLLHVWMKTKEKLVLNHKAIGDVAEAADQWRTDMDTKFGQINSKVGDILGELHKLKPH